MGDSSFLSVLLEATEGEEHLQRVRLGLKRSEGETLSCKIFRVAV